MKRPGRTSKRSPKGQPNRWDTICLLQEMLGVLRRLAVEEEAKMLVYLIDQAILDVQEVVAGDPQRRKNFAEMIESAPCKSSPAST